jgi:hypothetical protein
VPEDGELLLEVTALLSARLVALVRDDARAVDDAAQSSAQGQQQQPDAGDQHYGSDGRLDDFEDVLGA